MTDRESVRKRILGLPYRQMLLLLPTSFGKSRIGMELALKDSPGSILIVVPRLVLIQNWKDEFIKWGNASYMDRLTFSTYAGLHKIQGHFDACIFDECHHITARVQELLSYITCDRTVLLSATVKRDLVYELKDIFKDLYVYRIGMKEAIDNNVLPDPAVYLLPLTLDNTLMQETIIKHPKGTRVRCFNYNEGWRRCLSDSNTKLVIKCTQLQKNSDYDRETEYWKNRLMRTDNSAVKNRWLFTAGMRLKWLASLKNSIVRNMLSYLKKERVLVFCNSIEQTEAVCPACINSKNDEALHILDMFNRGEIDHISACGMLNEGMNLTDCRVGIFANLNSSEILQVQRGGRILRHPEPVIIIPYYKDTREEELKDKMLENYNKELVRTVGNINQIVL